MAMVLLEVKQKCCHVHIECIHRSSLYQTEESVLSDSTILTHLHQALEAYIGSIYLLIHLKITKIPKHLDYIPSSILAFSYKRIFV